MVLQVGVVFPDVAQGDDSDSQVHQRLAAGVVAVKVSSLVFGEGVGRWLSSWSRASGQLLVESNDISHLLSVGVGSDVLENVSIDCVIASA